MERTCSGISLDWLQEAQDYFHNVALKEPNMLDELDTRFAGCPMVTSQIDDDDDDDEASTELKKGDLVVHKKHGDCEVVKILDKKFVNLENDDGDLVKKVSVKELKHLKKKEKKEDKKDGKKKKKSKK